MLSALRLDHSQKQGLLRHRPQSRRRLEYVASSIPVKVITICFVECIFSIRPPPAINAPLGTRLIFMPLTMSWPVDWPFRTCTPDHHPWNCLEVMANCHFYLVGCRAGSHCPYRHVQPKEQVTATRQDRGHQQTGTTTESTKNSRSPMANASTSSTSRKPVSRLQQANPREYQLGQVMRRFSARREDSDNATVLTFTLKPSDPDFPFDLVGLDCSLTIPTSYPGNGKSSLRITNREIARGYQINVEKGFDSLVAESPTKTLLALLNGLDKNLERILKAEKAQTIKIIANVEKGSKAFDPVVPVAPVLAQAPVAMEPPSPSWTVAQRTDALAKRQADIRQLEARMGRLPNFSKSVDGTSFNVPVQIAKPGRLPLDLQPLKEIVLTVPKLYNLEPCTVHLKGVYGPEAESVHLSFEKHAREQPELTLMAQINYLIHNIETMALEVIQKPTSMPEPLETAPSDLNQAILAVQDENLKPQARILDEDRPHVQVIARPPEWDRHSDLDSDSGSSYTSEVSTDPEDEEDDEDDEDETQGGGASLPAASTSPEKGVHVSFPNLELYNIELLTLASLSLSVRCLRCKSALDVHNIKPSNSAPPTSTSTSITRTESCAKCTTPFTITYNSTPLHANTVRAGTIDVTGCTITDLLPSTFQPTCSSCSTTFPTPPGMISVRGDTPIQVCRSCHAKMTFTIPEVKFLRVSHSAAGLPARRPKKENLGISAGTPLPRNGTCTHYRHSYRWFRFGCCGRVYACDRCHDAAEAHVNEHADRMVCGWCSREQRFRPDDCGVCGRSVMKRRRAAGGFWEGGQGTRERRLMSRKEKRKYKRPGAAVPGGKKTDGGK